MVKWLEVNQMYIEYIRYIMFTSGWIAVIEMKKLKRIQMQNLDFIISNEWIFGIITSCIF